MAITRERKEELVELYTELLGNTKGMIVTEYRGMKITHFQTIRKALREVGASYFVTKNRLFKIALRNAGLPAPDELLNGPVAVGFAHNDLAAMIKVFLDKKKEQELLILKGGVAGQSVFNADDLETISQLPTIDVLRAQLAGMLIQPAQGVVNILAAPPAHLVGVLDAATSSIVNVLLAYANKNDEEAA